MNITITPHLLTKPNNQAAKCPPPVNSGNYPNLKPLAKDQVSFSGTLSRAIDSAYLDNQQVFINTSRQLHTALKNVCKKLTKYGFEYDEAYNSKHPIKSFDGFRDKFARQGSVADLVRGTVYWPNQRDINAFDAFIKAMDDEGFVVADLRKYNSKTGRYQTVPDLEIRQDGIEKEDLKILGSFLSRAEISRPRVSTYSDYQARFKRKEGNGKSVEVIFLYGKEYAKAKELESKYVYNIMRALRDRLHIDMKENYAEKTPGRRIVNNIKVIGDRLVEDVSKPLFTNAYNAIFKIRGENLPIVISKAHATMLDGYMSGIRQKIPQYYKDLNKKIKSDEYIVDYIKKSVEYNVRDNKTITPEEIHLTREKLKELIPLYEAEDKGTVYTAHELLKETIKKYGEK